MNLIAEFAAYAAGLVKDWINPYKPKPMPNHLVAICIGHSRFIGGKRDGGAVSVGGVSEWTYNRELALKLHQTLANVGVSSFVEDKYEGNGYTDSMRWLASYLKGRNATLAIELHFNAATGKARGHEWLYWGSSQRSNDLAGFIAKEFEKLGTGIPSRGTKPRTSADRGGEFLRLTHCPAVICEPFFGSNPIDWVAAKEHQTDIAKAIATGLVMALQE